MKSLSEPSERLFRVGLGLTMALLLLALSLVLLKIYSTSGKPLPVYAQVADFTLTNQNGGVITIASLRGHVWVGDIIFTRCPGPCLKMTRQMKELQQSLPAKSDSKLVTLTTDPDFDTPAVLKAYAERFGANTNHWMFLTGSKQQIASLAIDSLKLTAVPTKPEERQSPEDLFVHSTIFVLVDKQGRLRGVYQTTGDGVDPAEVKTQILDAVRRLEREA